MSESVDALKEFWNNLEESPITIHNIEILKSLMANVFNKVGELEKSRELWRTKYQNLKSMT